MKKQIAIIAEMMKHFFAILKDFPSFERSANVTETTANRPEIYAIGPNMGLIISINFINK